MTSDQIVKAVSSIGLDIETFSGPNASPEFANLRATLEVAYQLALLNENFGEMMGNLFNNSNPQIRVMVEPGDWPIQTQEQKR